jgi:YedE family putative selenium metabolism protein
VKSYGMKVLLAGAVLGGLGSLLSFLGNPANTGFCVSCFMENSAGALGLHGELRMSYMRPELTGFLLGGFLTALIGREFKPRASGAGVTAFILGMLMLIGSAVFIGCPIKLILRLSAGDLTAVAGGAGLVAGVWLGLYAMRHGDPALESENIPAPLPVALTTIVIAATLGMLVFAEGVLRKSTGGGGSIHAPMLISLAAGLAVGAASQRTRFCVTGSVRDMLLTRRASMGLGLVGALGAALIVSAMTGQFNPGYFDQPGVHLEWVWSFLSMALVGWAAVVSGGCPFRQIVKTGEGDMDAALVCAGMFVGAILVQQWGLGSTAAGVPLQGKAAVLLGFAFLAALCVNRGGRR